MLTEGKIHLLAASAGSPVLFVPKNNGKGL
jgi:hypothetical protein